MTCWRTKAWVTALVLLCGASAMQAGQSAPANEDEISFERDWPVQTTPYYRVVVRGNASGTVALSRDASQPVTEIHVSTATRDLLFAVQPVLASAKGCETGGKKLAQTGVKTLTLRRGGTVLTCTFNYSDDRRVQEAVNAFSGIEMTLEEAPKLVHLRRYDRLGLDAEIASFADAVQRGRAIELGNIAPVLRLLAGDGDLMERVRNRATDLLTMAEAGK